MIVFDLEWNSGRYERLKLNEILQIGAVKLERLGGPILDTLNLYIRPKAHKRYAPPVVDLPGLPLIESSDLDFPAAARIFFDWCGEDRCFGTWGTGDFAALVQNFRYWKLPLDRLPDSYYNLQAAFVQAVGAKNQVALHCAVEYCGFPDLFDYHDPQNDAFYTALVTWAFDEESLRRSARPSGQENARVDLTVHHPRWRSGELGPFPSAEAALNDRGCRLAPCPCCARKVRVSDWHSEREGTWMARFSCKEHGDWFLRLKLFRKPDREGLLARTEVLDNTEGARLLFQGAKAGKSFLCSALRRVRKRRAKARREKNTGSKMKMLKYEE